MESTLSGRPPARPAHDESPLSRKRDAYQGKTIETEHSDTLVPYAELHVHSHYSFLDGASSPEQLLEEAKRLGLTGMAITDHDGFYGAVRLAETAESYPEVKTIFGAELSLDLSGPQNGVTDPEGSHLLVLARGESGYHRLATAITRGQLNGAEKGRPIYDLDELSTQSGGQWLILTGCRKGRVRQALAAAPSPAEGAAQAALELAELVRLFGQDNVAVELFDHGHPLDSSTNDVLAALAAAAGLPIVASNVVHYATPAEHRLASAVAAVRARRSLDEMDGWLPASDGAHLRSGEEMAARFARFPGAIEQTVIYAEELAFTLRSARPGLPKQDVPTGHTPMSWLRDLVWKGAARKYPTLTEAMCSRIERELDVIELKDFSGYFLIVYDIVREARSRGILCQGRGSAANSAVCYLLDITAVDSIRFDLPFERFLSSIRDEEPDIDVDFDSNRREEIIQYVYNKYGRNNAAQVANVISYRPKVAVRDMAKALGYSPGQQDAWSRQMERWGKNVQASDPETEIPDAVIELATQLLTFPRHLGIHSGGMVLTDRPVGEVCPIEHARKENRTVLQWDKDDCAWMGLVKFDLLGLGMLAALQYAFDMARDTLGEDWNLDTLPKEEAGVYDMLCRADSIGVFQVESRAQMGTLPRLKPRKFYDLVVEIALIRPGPVQGGAVHPYIRRKTGKEEITYLHPKLKPVLERTCGIPIFQEQLMQMAVAVGNCTAEDADLLRRAMGSKRGVEKIGKLKAKLYEGMAENGIDDATADVIYAKIEAFANFGFAESHSLSFALLVYASSWIKLHYPGIFLASLLRAQPMGFYSPQSLTADARRHGVEVRRPDILRSDVHAVLERVELAPHDATTAGSQPRSAPALTGMHDCLNPEQPAVPDDFERSQANQTAAHRRDGAYAVRLGLSDVASIGTELAERIVAERTAHGPYRSMADVSRRVGLDTAQLEALSAAGAFSSLGMERREALWSAGDAAQDKAQYLAGSVVVLQPPLLPILSAAEQVIYDLWATGISPDDHPVRHVRPQLDRRGALTVAALETAESGRRIEIGGVVTHRQRPGTAGGITFLNIEDETGTLNVIASVGVWSRYRRIARESPALIVRGILERTEEGVTNILADRFEPLQVSAAQRSRDFR